MNDNKWHSGPPPSVGWWIASKYHNNNWLRWWDGKNWSFPAHKTVNNYRAAEMASKINPEQHGVNWQHRPDSWPARSRT